MKDGLFWAVVAAACIGAVYAFTIAPVIVGGLALCFVIHCVVKFG